MRIPKIPDKIGMVNVALVIFFFVGRPLIITFYSNFFVYLGSKHVPANENE
jgi:hypothetical protein